MIFLKSLWVIDLTKEENIKLIHTVINYIILTDRF